jgi:NTP pyrophosphatase (non-canonical NTP hydrolase)
MTLDLITLQQQAAGGQADFPAETVAALLVRVREQEAAIARLTAAQRPDPDLDGALPFQERVWPWVSACFGPMIAVDPLERNHRFLEEALELCQACGATAQQAHQLVDYVFGRDVGDREQEVGGIMVTLAALCAAMGIDMHAAGETELARIWTRVSAIRAKHAAKPKFVPARPEAPPAV